MKFITNAGSDDHGKLINQLILSSSTIVMCSGWIKLEGIREILPSLDKAIRKNNAKITIFSNKKHTEAAVHRVLKKYDNIRHIILDNTQKYLHSKIYYFQCGTKFTTIIGSANITKGGLLSNEELSVKFSGQCDTQEHNDVIQYFNAISENI